MRVIAGVARSKRLKTLEGEETRPTIERVKEGIFSSVQFVIEGARVLDLFAGSGQMGIEALSRGADFAVFIDQNPEACKIVTDNCRTCGVFAQSRVATMTAQSFLAQNHEKFDLVFVDPPYRHDTVQQLLPELAQHVNSGGFVICETELECDLPQQLPGLRLAKQYRYGKVLVTKYQRDEE